jgi:hypothetical protein
MDTRALETHTILVLKSPFKLLFASSNYFSNLSRFHSLKLGCNNPLEVKRSQIITLIFFILILAISIRVGNGLRSQATCLVTNSFPEVYDNSSRVLTMFAAVFSSNPCEKGRT